MNRIALFLAACTVAAVAPLISIDQPPAPPAETVFPGWFPQWEGALLRRLPVSEREKQFAAGFPGQVAQFHDGRRILLFRFTEQITRKLHPAAHCFRGSGYRLEAAAQRTDAQGNRWSCSLAVRAEEKLRVCERIFDNTGRSFPDVSSWYWSSAFGVSRGPWWAVTTVESAAHDIL
jgi:hypothetical protein